MNEVTASPSVCSLLSDGNVFQPRQRALLARRARIEQVERERDGSSEVCQDSNDDRNRDGSFLLMAKFHKSLPHDSLGQVRGLLKTCSLQDNPNLARVSRL